jgi:hypothetical protein
LLDRPDKMPAALEGITKDGVGIYYIGRRLPTEAERLVEQYTALETLGRFDECVRIIDRLAAIPDLPAGFVDGFKASYKGRAHMGLSVVSHSRNPKFALRKPRGRGGLNGIVPEAKRMVRSGCVMLERAHARGDCAFFTGTLPSGLTSDEQLKCSENAGYLIERFIEEIRRELARHGLETHRVLGVIEIQTKRYVKHGDICIHIHVVFPARKPDSDWLVKVEKAQDIWCRLVENLLGRAVSRKAMTQLAKVRKPLINEMGKYLSKAAKASSAMIAAHPDFIPHSWVYIPQAFRREIKDAIEVYDGEQVSILMENIKLLERAGIAKSRAVYAEVDGREIIVGHTGFFLPGYELSQFLCDSKEELIERINFVKKGKLRRDRKAA